MQFQIPRESSSGVTAYFVDLSTHLTQVLLPSKLKPMCATNYHSEVYEIMILRDEMEQLSGD